jgi:hypothetical protein
MGVSASSARAVINATRRHTPVVAHGHVLERLSLLEWEVEAEARADAHRRHDDGVAARLPPPPIGGWTADALIKTLEPHEGLAHLARVGRPLTHAERQAAQFWDAATRTGPRAGGDDAMLDARHA